MLAAGPLDPDALRLALEQLLVVASGTVTSGLCPPRSFHALVGITAKCFHLSSNFFNNTLNVFVEGVFKNVLGNVFSITTLYFTVCYQ